MPHLRSLGGYCILLGLAWLLSADRRRFPWRTVIGGTVLQFAVGLFVLKTAWGRAVFEQIGALVATVIQSTDSGSRFIFGNLVDKDGPWGFVFATRALPNIIVFASLSSIGYHFGVLQRVVAAMALVMTRFMRVSGAESLSAAANVFLGQTEAPLLVRPYIPGMTPSELNAVMVGGFATIAGSLMAVYMQMLGHDDPAIMAEMAGHLLTASLLSAPAGLVMAKVLLPESGEPATAGTVRMRFERRTVNTIDAAASGALEGLQLALNVAAMLIAFIAIIFLLDVLLAWIGGLSAVRPLVAALGLEQLSLDGILGLIFYPVAWLIGVPTDDCRSFGSLLGRAMAANEFLAYSRLAELIKADQLSPRSVELAVYALCGFANFSSIAIQVAGIGSMAPDRRHELARLGLRAMLGGAMACWMTACLAGMLT